MSFETIVTTLCIIAGIILTRKRIQAWLRLILHVFKLLRCQLNKNDAQAAYHARRIVEELERLDRPRNFFGRK